MTASTGTSLVAKHLQKRREHKEAMEQMVRCPDCWREVRALVEGEAVNFCPRCQFPLKLVGNKYRLETRLGAGAFGTVYRARHIEVGNHRAIKIMRWDTANSKAPDEWTSGRKQKKQREFEARFQKEVRLTALLAKENWHIVRLDDAGADDVLGLYYIMEYLEGAPLRSLMSEWPFLTRRIAFSIMEQVCRGAATAHRMGVIHRDLKPENIILLKQEDAGRFVKILDFGLAKMLGDDAIAMTSRPMGTPLYMSPEQCANREVDQRADIYALGCIFFHLLAGSPPYHEVTETPQLFIHHMQAPPPSLRERCPDMEVPEGLDMALQFAMAKAPSARPISVEAFWNSIAPFARWHEQIWRYGAAQTDSQATFFPTGEASDTPLNLWGSGDTKLTPQQLDSTGQLQYESDAPYDSDALFDSYYERREQRRRQRWRIPALVFVTAMALWFGAYGMFFHPDQAPSTTPPPNAHSRRAAPGPPAEGQTHKKAAATGQVATSHTAASTAPNASVATPAISRAANQSAPATSAPPLRPRRVAKARQKAPARTRPAPSKATQGKGRSRRQAWIGAVKLKGVNAWPGAQRAMVRAGWLEKTTPPSGTSQTSVPPGPRVRISRSFWMWRTEITQGQFQALMGYNPSRFQRCGSRCPVESLNWHEAAAFANALSRKQNRPACYSCAGKGASAWCRPYPQYSGANYNRCKGWRLPTEAEWEYAYRAGTRTAFYTGPCLTGEQANFNSTSQPAGCASGAYRRRTLSSGQYPPNPLGLYDMAGNVWEWVYDSYQERQAFNSPDPIQEGGNRRVLRGGGYYSSASECHANARQSYVATKRSLILGFRIVRTR